MALLFIKYFLTGRIFLEQGDALKNPAFFVFLEGRKKNGTVVKKGTGIASLCCLELVNLFRVIKKRTAELLVELGFSILYISV